MIDRTADKDTYIEVLHDMLAAEQQRVARLEAVVRAHVCPSSPDPGQQAPDTSTLDA